METGENKKSKSKESEGTEPPDKLPAMEPEGEDPISAFFDPEKGRGRPKRDGQESDEERLADLEAFMRAQQEAAQEALKPPMRDQVPPRDAFTGATAEYSNIMSLKPGTGESFGERDAFAARLREKARSEQEEKLKKSINAVHNGAHKNVSQERIDSRRDVTAMFNEGRSSIGNAGDRDRSGGERRDISGRDRKTPDHIGNVSEKFQHRDISGNGPGDRDDEARKRGQPTETHRDVTGGIPASGIWANGPWPSSRRDVTAFTPWWE
jgi:hypothetical protein